MAEIIKSIEVDVAKLNTFPAVVAKQGDTLSRFLKVQLLNESEPLAVDSGATVIINVERVDGQSKAFSGSVNTDGSVTVPLTAWTLEIDGKARCSVSIVIGEKRLTSTTFYVNVEHAEYTDSDYSEDDDTSDLFLQLLMAAENEDARITAENARITAETARQNAETARQTAETTRLTKENERVSAETARNNAESARATAAAQAVTNANTAAQSANNAAQQVASALIAGGVLPIYDEDEDKNYTYQIKIKNGYPVLTMVEAATTD